MQIQTINPATGTTLKTYDTFSSQQVAEKITAAYQAFLAWRQQPIAQRSILMHKAADILLASKLEYATLITTEMGKPITYAIQEIERCASTFKHFADQTGNYLKAEPVVTDYQKSLITYQPIGALFAIMPWNFPFGVPASFIAPNLMAGNTILLKHAPITTGCGLALEAIFCDAGFPAHVFQSLIITEEQAANVIAHPKIAGVTLTGSQSAGRSVATEAGKALKKVLLELGGNDPYIILADADLDLAADLCVNYRLYNSGQICISAKRLIIVESVFEQFQQKIFERLPQYCIGDPMDPHTQLGPLAREDLRQTVHQQVQKTVAEGAVLLQGGELLDGLGYFYPITVLRDVKPGMTAFEEEIFGPVLSLISARDETHAIELANLTEFGLGAGVFTQDSARGEKIATEQLEAGTCTVNCMVASDPRLPFGGNKRSGIGRELGCEGTREFTNIKVVHVK